MRMTPTRSKRRVPSPLEERKARFRIALAHARLTAAEWAEENDVKATYLSRFLAGKTTSKPLDEKVAAFIAKYSQNVA